MDVENSNDYIEMMAYIEWLEAQQPAAPIVAQVQTEQRTRLDWLSNNGVSLACSGTKPHSGRLSPGCKKCTTGNWSCVFLNYDCTADCFFCPKEHTDATTIGASYLKFPSIEPFLDFAEQTEVSGISISGGEPLLVLDKVLFWFRQIRQRFGEGVYLWLYSNGDLLDPYNLTELKESGLNEIRINISARNYDLGRVALASEVIDTVSVEIPAIPEDLERLKGILPELARLGVKHLNLHQLFATQSNYKALRERKYTYLDPTLRAFVWESEQAALELIEFSIEQRIKLPINFCSSEYKNRYQTAYKRQIAAKFLQKDDLYVTSSGYLRQIVMEEAPVQDIGTLVQTDLQGKTVTLQYYNAELINIDDPLEFSQGGQLIEINSDFAVEGVRWLAAEFTNLPAEQVTEFFAGGAKQEKFPWVREAQEYEFL